jgi:SAM-dependent methyltransferase
MVRRNSSLSEKVLFANPALYKLKGFVIETVIWKWLLCGVFRLKPCPLSDTEDLFQGRRVLMAACGPGDVSTGPSVDSAAEVLAVDVSTTFVETCHKNRPTWKVCVADVLELPFADGEFDVSMIYSSLHHIPSSAELVLAELARVTRGRVVFLEGVVPKRGLLRHILLLWYAIMDGGVHYYTREEILDIAARLGLEMERTTQHGPIGHMMFGVVDVRRPARRVIRPVRGQYGDA